MLWGIVIGAAVLLALVAIAVYTTWQMRTRAVPLPEELTRQRTRLAARLDTVIDDVPSTSSLLGHAVPTHPRAAVIEAKLFANQPLAALDEAEHAVADDPDNASARVLLARALVHCNEPVAAARQIAHARQLGASGAMVDYLDARAQHLLLLRETNVHSQDVQQSPIPSMITPFEQLILQLEKQRRISEKAAAVWLANMGDTTMGHDDIFALVVEHFTKYYRTLELLLRAVEQQPAFGEALYHTARMAMKVGFVEQGRRLFNKLEPLMEHVPERPFFDRDLAELRDEPETETAFMPTVSSSGKKAIKLKVLQ